jgi:drug/metabolite transporter (DMT)-like permease
VKLSRNQGILLALGAAIVSGVSIYVNKFGVAQVSDPFIYTTVKNSVVVVGLLAAVGLLASWKELRDLTPMQWLAWIGLGVIGGGVPFLLFFQGLSSASAASASLLQKTLFIWVALLAVPLLRERLGLWQVLGLAILAVGRMAIGALVMWAFLTITGRAGRALTLNDTQWFWVMITAVLLMVYVWTWYSALKWAKASLVTSVLTIGAIVTILLSVLLDRHATTTPQVVAISLLVLGAALFAFARRLQWRRAPEVA